MSRITQIVTGMALGMALFGVASNASADRGDRGDHEAGKKDHAPKAAKSVPEISGQQAGVGLALVLGGAAIVVGRRRKPKLG